MSKEVSITIEDAKCVVASPEAACVTAFYATSEDERSDMYQPMLRLLAAVLRLNGLGQCNTKEEVKELLGETLLWFFCIHFVYAQEGDRSVSCKWFKSHEWSTRGPDRCYDEWTCIMGGVREKTARLAGVFCRYGSTSPKVRSLTSASTLMPSASTIVHDRTVPGEDLRALCDMYKLSPRECFEAAVLKRKDILDATHKKFCGKNKQKKLP